MRHIIFQNASQYPIAVLIKGTAFNQAAIESSYLQPLKGKGITSDQVIAFSLVYTEANKAPVKLIKEYLDKLLPALDSQGVKYIYVADAQYFKKLVNKPKAEPHIGYALPCAVKGFEHMQVVLGLNYQALVYDPSQQSKLNLTLDTLANAVGGTYQALGTDIIHYSEHPETLDEIRAVLEKLHQYPELTCDIEAFSLSAFEAGIATIGFAWNQHEGISFACDYRPFLDPEDIAATGLHGYRETNWAVRFLVKKFLEDYEGKLTYHNAAFDVRSMIAALWMNDPLDRAGMLKGLDILTRDFDDTKIITYLATNSTAGNELSLKAQSHEFAGNYAQDDDDIKNVLRIPLHDLLTYNLIDCLATWFVKTKWYSTMVADKQEQLYFDLMLPSLKTIIQMELVGMPMERSRVIEVKAELEKQEQEFLGVIQGHPVISALKLLIQTQKMVAANAKLKVKQHPLSHFADVEFNPNSNPQLQQLVYDMMGLPVIDYTDSKQPSTASGTLEKLIHHTTRQDYKDILQALIQYSKVTKILSSFIPAFEKAMDKADGKAYLHGNFNLGGTVSGRLSSSKPNMQNLPAGSFYGKLIKSCFSAPKGWLMVGADFNSLEDYISALTTKDPNKLKVYLQKYDGHCLRAFSYFPEKLPGIVDTVESINSIKKKFPDIRQDSKGPTFALTYLGTWITLVRNLGFDEVTAKRIEAGYHELYKVSDDYVAERLKRACKDGYVEVAFGLRVRTPLLSQTILGMRKTPFAAEAEGRTAGNALGQSYGLLNNRAANAFMEKVRASKYRLDVMPIALIHDAIYLLVRDEPEIVKWVNDNLIHEMQWQELPEIQHDQVKLGANLGIFWPNWSSECELPNGSSVKEIQQICEEYQQVLLNPKTDKAA